MNKKRKMRLKNSNSSDNYYNKLRRSKGTPIKEGNDKGGKIVLRPKLYNKINKKKDNIVNTNNKQYNSAVLI